MDRHDVGAQMQQGVDIRRIEWQQTIPLRHSVLWPNESPEFCRVEGDEDAWHFGAFRSQALVSVVSVVSVASVASVYIAGHVARLRKFATAAECQGQGIGSALLKHILAELSKNGIRHFWCDARESAKGFYQRFGLKSQGDRFYKGQVPYFKMSVEFKWGRRRHVFPMRCAGSWSCKVGLERYRFAAPAQGSSFSGRAV